MKEELMEKEAAEIASLELDPAEFREDLAEFELSKKQEEELFHALVAIMRSFVEIGWGVDNVQMFFPELFEKTGRDSGKLLESKHTEIIKHESASTAGKDDS